MIQEIEKQFTNLKLGKLDSSLAKIKEILTNPQMTDDLRFDVAEYFYQLGFIAEALTIVQELIQRHPHENELILFLAELYIEDGAEEEALDLLNSIHPEEEEFIRAALLKADLYLLQGLDEVAEYKLKEAIEHYPDEALLYTALGEIFYQKQHYQLALINFLRGETEAYDKLADCYAHLGQFEEALPMYKQALQVAEQPDLLFGHGFVATQLGEWALACNSLDKLVQLDPYYTSAYPLLAEAYMNLGEEEEALTLLEAGLTYDQTNPQLFYLKGELLLRQSQRQEARKYFERSLELDETYTNSLEKLIDIAEQEEDWVTCLSLVKRMLDNYLERADLYVRQGYFYEELEEWSKAEQSYRDALHYNAEDIEALNRLALLLRDEGSREEAIQLWRRSLSIEPNQWEIAEFLQRLEEE